MSAVSRVLRTPTSWNDENVLATVGLGATWPVSGVLAEGVEIGPVALRWMGAGARLVGRAGSRGLLHETDAVVGGQRSG